MQGNLDFQTLSKEWLDLKRFSVKYSTYIKYKNIINLYLKKLYLHKNVNDIKEKDICLYFEKLIEKHFLSQSTINSASLVLKSILSFGEHQYHLKHIDFSYIKFSSLKKDIITLSYYEEKKLSDYCLSHFNQTTLAIYISLYTGMRLGEICGLQWKDIDLMKGYIYISKTVQRIESHHQYQKTEKIILEPKTQSSKRIVVMSDCLIQYIISHQQKTYVPTFFILSNSQKIPEPRNIQRNFKKICYLLDMNMNFHILRHTFATNCIKYGIDIKTLCELLGHSNVSTTLNLYVHPTLEFKREQINKYFNKVS